jgi:hypothetical protein
MMPFVTNRSLRCAALLLLGTSFGQPVLAQDPGLFTLDTVLVAPFESANDVVKPESRRIETLIRDRLKRQYILVELEAIEKFDQGYDARTYMDSCPPGQHMGCAFVVGGRAGAEWTVTGKVADDLDGLAVKVSFIDITNSNVSLTFGVTLDGTNDDVFVDGVATVLDKIISGAAEEVDIRGSLDDPEARAALEAAQASMIASSLAELEDTLGEVEQQMMIEVEAPKLSRDDLRNLEGREDGTPWDNLEMSQSEFLRYRNSGKPLSDWRRLSNGRAGQLLARIAFGGGTGPFEQIFDGRYVLDDTDLQVIETSEFQEISNGGNTFVEFELGVGVHRWFEVTGLFGFRSAPYYFLFHQQVQNDDPDTIRIKPAEKDIVNSMHFGARMSFVPLTTYPVRPTVGAGFVYWMGTTLNQVVVAPPAIKELPANSLFLIQLTPGGEVSLGRYVNVFARAVVDIPLFGKTEQLYHDGASSLNPRPEPAREWTAGIGGQAGVQLRFGPFRKFNEEDDMTIIYEDEEF